MYEYRTVVQTAYSLFRMLLGNFEYLNLYSVNRHWATPARPPARPHERADERGPLLCACVSSLCCALRVTIMLHDRELDARSTP